jgi:hypothetical protein
MNDPIEVDDPADRVESPPHRWPPTAMSSAAAFDPMAFLKEWGEKMQLMHHQQP